MNTTHEFRAVHASKLYLDSYIQSGRNLDVIRSISMSQIGRFDVWQSVFGKEPEAYRELCIKEWYNTFFEAKKDTNDELLILKYEMGVMRLIQLEEWNTPFTVDDGIKIIIDCFGKDVLPKIIIEAEKNVKQREEIVKPYVKQDDQWVGYAKNVLNKLKQYNIE